MNWNTESSGFAFEWSISDDSARLESKADGKVIWRGSLLPSLVLLTGAGEKVFVKSRATGGSLDDSGGEIALDWEGFGIGALAFAPAGPGLRFSRLSIEWADAPPKIHSAYFGAVHPSGALRRDEPFWPGWQADGICVPSAKGAPPQSFFRFWDLGQAHMALGSFGPTGTPYAAAFPRPIYAAGLGSGSGWLVAGPGQIPASALYLQVVAGASCLHYLHREDLWGSPAGTRREWAEPLRLSWASTAWEAYRRHFSTFDIGQADASHQRSSWNSWSEYRQGIYENERLVRTVTEAVQPEIFTFDDGWETGNSSGRIRRDRFPNFEDDLELVRSLGMDVGLWQAVGWIEDPAAEGLGPEDLLCGTDGTPCLANWLCSPNLPGRYVLDPSSQKTREFIRQKTRRLVKTFGAKLLKLDFGYGAPSLESAAPRDPSMRGERLASTLYGLMSEAARECDPSITLQGWGLSPLQRPAFNLIAMDDLGDCGAEEGGGHRHWSVWAALIGDQGMGILASSGYDWKQDADVILDTAVLGAPGAVLSMKDDAGNIAYRGLAKRRAIHRWFRRTVKWAPLWLNSEIGQIDRQPLVKCWGRLEPSPAGEVLTALALRDGEDKLADRSALRGMDWVGRWAILSQDSEDLFFSGEVACIPFDEGTLHFPCQSPPREIIGVTGDSEAAETGWKWSDGFLSLDSTSRKEGFTGFLIRR
ncbi:MAG: hypothetical protein WCS65_04560 [Verrucomicrobiae bacterium]